LKPKEKNEEEESEDTKDQKRYIGIKIYDDDSSAL
jgi:hypothetical protein